MAQRRVDKLIVYKSFWRGGTTSGVSNMFKKSEKNMIDTTNINVGGDTFLSEFEAILTTSKQNKHFQQKITDIEIAGEFWYPPSEKHFYLICSSNLLIDITNKIEYKITDKLLLKEMKDWIKRMKQTKQIKE